MHVCMHACTHVGMYARMYVCMYVRAYKFVCMSTPTTVRMCVSVSICIVQSPGFLKPYLEHIRFKGTGTLVALGKSATLKP